MQLGRHARIRLAHLPTPLEPLEALSRHLGGPQILVKRDDCTGLAFGGNKTRKLEFLMAAALAEGADTVITCGGAQSNHVRQTAAAAAKLGLKCALVQQTAQPWDDPDYATSGNMFLDRLLGASSHAVPTEADRAAGMAALAEEIRGQGGKPYIIPGGGSNALGGLGYAGCALEIVTQANALDLAVDYVVLPSGGGGTQGGLVAGLVGANAGIRAIGIDIDAEARAVTERVREVAEGSAELLGVRGGIDADVVVVEGAYAGEAYGVPTPEMVAAVKLLARIEGLVLDPVYTGKAMAGLIDLVATGRFKASDTVVFIHTGGLPALFAYRGAFGEL
ncbi:MAG: D-cysteine desulfhydrase [Alphaproteobacteria bacterium]|jgi:L-cysteate sulfo-lyase|nr:D-cysteine desulfhydrase [Alphaproteobacteria bacterium]